MRKTAESIFSYDERLTLTTDELRMYLGCGRVTAVEIGKEAKAKVQTGGRRILWNRKKIDEYINSISE